jgi:hypothetical protein
VLADYECYALWIDDDEGHRNVDPAGGEIEISRELVGDLNEWSAEYSAILNHEDPAASGFESLDVEEDFVARGLGLAWRVKHEIGPAWNVQYFNIIKMVDIAVNGGSAGDV